MERGRRRQGEMSPFSVLILYNDGVTCGLGVAGVMRSLIYQESVTTITVAFRVINSLHGGSRHLPVPWGTIYYLQLWPTSPC